MADQNNLATTLNLLNLDILSSFLGISGLLILILTSYQGKRVLLEPKSNTQNSTATINLDFAALTGRLLLVTAGFISANTNTLRLQELARQAAKNKNRSAAASINPDIWLTLGAWIAFGGGIFALVGDYQRLRNPSRVPVAE